MYTISPNMIHIFQMNAQPLTLSLVTLRSRCWADPLLGSYSLRELLVQTGSWRVFLSEILENFQIFSHRKTCLWLCEPGMFFTWIYLKIFKYFHLEKHATSQFAQVICVVSTKPLLWFFCILVARATWWRAVPLCQQGRACWAVGDSTDHHHHQHHHPSSSSSQSPLTEHDLARS